VRAEVPSMAVYKSKDAFRVKQWCSDTYKGSTRHKKFFATKAEAEEYDATQTLSPVSKSGWDKIKVKSLVERYRDEIAPTLAGYKGDKDNTTYRLNYMLTHNPGKTLCGYSLSDLVGEVQAWEYIRARQKQTTNRGTKVTMRTISKERNILQRVFALAIKEWGYVGLTNPFHGLDLKGSKYKRTRRLEDGEYENLIETAQTTCHGLNKRYVVLAIDIAIETAMREQEVFNLQWKDIDFERRLITVNKSKMDYAQQSPGRKIVLPYRTLIDLVCLKSDIEYYEKREIKKTECIFPKTQDAIIQAFERVVERAGIKDLVYADLRREATSRWGDNEPALTVPQMKLMDGHAQSDNDINSTYNIPALKEIRDKLDRQFLGMTFEEKHSEALENGWRVYDIIKEIYWMPLPVFKTEKSVAILHHRMKNQKVDEKTKQGKKWKRMRFMAELQKLTGISMEQHVDMSEDEIRIYEEKKILIRKRMEAIPEEKKMEVFLKIYGDGPYPWDEEEKTPTLEHDADVDAEYQAIPEPVQSVDKISKQRLKPRDSNWKLEQGE
jgi:integrase